MSTKTYTFHVHGMHCKSCSILITHALSEVAGIEKVVVNEHSHTAIIESSRDVPPEQLAVELTKYIEKDGYTLALEKKKHEARWRDLFLAIPIVALIATAFILLQYAGLVDLINAEQVSYPVAFVIGLVASVSSCLAVVGGLLLSVAANYAKSERKVKPQLYFHIGRLVTFFVLGGAIGMLGSAFSLSTAATVTLSIIIGIVMLILGVNLLDVFPAARKLQFFMPKFLTHQSAKVKSIEHDAAPLLIGASTFFLPCGFTQSMQLYTLSTGDFLTGALTMFVFALGTLPVLALISVTSMKLGKGKTGSVFFKTAGLLVILFALLNILNALVAAGYVPPLFTF